MLSVIIPAKNEKYLEQTMRNVLENARGEIEVIAELDGWVPSPQIDLKDDRAIFVHHKESIGQRACINHGASIAKGKYIMKLDAHCAVDEGFDVKLAEDCKYEWTIIPRMYNLDIKTFKPKKHKRTDYMYISSPTAEKPFRAVYYGSSQPKNDIMIDDTMCCMGPGWFLHKDRFLEQGGCDEGHGGWGQQGVEVACKAWLSGGALKVNKKTWFAHWFRGGTYNAETSPGFPYKISGNDQKRARAYSQDIWLNDKWPLAKRKFKWMIDKFKPPLWDYDLTILYYSANKIHKAIEYTVLRSLKQHGYPIVSVTQEPMELGKNIVVEKKRSLENIYEQVLTAAKEATTTYVALCEDDCLYTTEHFRYKPTKPFAYNLNRWNLHLWVREPDKQCFSYREKPVLSQCIAHRETLIKCLEEEVRSQEMGLDGKYEYETFKTKTPNLNFCHRANITGRKFIGQDAEPRTELSPYQDVDYWVQKFKRRGLDCEELIKT